MTLTRDHAQMLATLARACRPHGAARWDEPGIMAALKQVADRDLASVIIATITAASDRDCETPGVIPTNGSHWTAAAKVAVTPPDNTPAGDRCTVCSKPEQACMSRPRFADDDHAFSPPRGPAQVDVARTVAALRDELAPVAPPAPEPTFATLTDRRPELAERVERIKATNPGVRGDAAMRQAATGVAS